MAGIEPSIQLKSISPQLIESMDNAADMQNMNMWPKVLDLLTDKQDPIIKLACWICGTAIQNNPKAQEAVSMTSMVGSQTSLNISPPSPQFHRHKPTAKLYSLISSIHPTNSSTQISNSTRAKAVYCLSAALKHWPGAVADLTDDSNRGWSTLRDGLSDPDPTIRRKIAFLINTLLIQSTDMPEDSTQGSTPTADGQPNEMVEKMSETQVFDALLKSLTKPLPMGADGDISEPDWDLQEKCTRALVSALERGGLDAEQRQTLAALWGSWKVDNQWENVGFTQSEAEQAKRLL